MDAQELRNLQEAYLEVVENQQLDEAYEPISRERENRMYRRAGNLARTALSSTGKKKKEAQKKSSTIVGVITRQRERERFNEIGKSPTHNEELDLYDIILSHLLDEGYAETPEAAEAIMVNMGEEWRDGILDEAYQTPRFNRKHYLNMLSKRGGMGMGTPEDPHGYRDPQMEKVGREFRRRKTAAAKATRTGEPDEYRAEKEAQSKYKG